MMPCHVSNDDVYDVLMRATGTGDLEKKVFEASGSWIVATMNPATLGTGRIGVTGLRSARRRRGGGLGLVAPRRRAVLLMISSRSHHDSLRVHWRTLACILPEADENEVDLVPVVDHVLGPAPRDDLGYAQGQVRRRNAQCHFEREHTDNRVRRQQPTSRP